jgi:hypothetical protein
MQRFWRKRWGRYGLRTTNHAQATAVEGLLGIKIARDIRYANGYLVTTLDPRTLVIRGRTEPATAHGVVGFLKRYVGVRQ